MGVNLMKRGLAGIAELFARAFAMMINRKPRHDELPGKHYKGKNHKLHGYKQESNPAGTKLARMFQRRIDGKHKVRGF